MILLIGLLIILSFGWVVLRGAPYLPTLAKQTDIALDLLALQPGQLLIDLGAGDGRVALAAAKRGIKVIGYEINPILWAIAWARSLRYRRLIRIKLRDFWAMKLTKCDGVFVFGIGHIMSRLEKKLESELKKGTGVVSFTFKLPNRKPEKIAEGLYLYRF